MIYDTFEHIGLYGQPGTRLHRALVYARDVARTAADGRTEIDGDQLYVRLTYETARENRFITKVHRRARFWGEEIIDVSLEKTIPF
jgi:beta-galactosidase beta subunit